MNPETEKIIREQMEKLPPEIRELFLMPDLGEKIIAIGKKNTLNVEQMGSLETETYLVMLGLVRPEEFESELKSNLKIDELKAKNIITDVNLQILSGIREKLEKLHEKKEGDAPLTESEELEMANQLKSIKVPVVSEAPKQAAPQPNKTPDVIKTNETQILNGAGIEIIPAPLEITGGKVKQDEKPAPIIVNTVVVEEKKDSEPHPILAQKLAGSFKMPETKTEYSLNNLSKAGEVKPVEGKELPKIDPYREIPE
ncbi:hypothetical protein K8Q98_03290 [Candidatus Nomurabacteria bacterium]|nr:hypothetical protein [Candidatus Nomurabacteria bacterium]